MGFSHSGQARQCDAYIFLCVFLALLAIRFRFSSPNALESWIQRLSRLLVRFLHCEVPVAVSARSSHRGACAVLHLQGEVLPWKLYLLIGPDTASMVMLGIKKSGEPFVPVTGRLGLKKQKNSATSSSSFAPGGNHCFSFSWRAALLL